MTKWILTRHGTWSRYIIKFWHLLGYDFSNAKFKVSRASLYERVNQPFLAKYKIRWAKIHQTMNSYISLIPILVFNYEGPQYAHSMCLFETKIWSTFLSCPVLSCPVLSCPVAEVQGGPRSAELTSNKKIKIKFDPTFSTWETFLAKYATTRRPLIIITSS